MGNAMLCSILFKRFQLVGRKWILHRKVLVDGGGIVVCCCKSPFRKHHTDIPVLESKECNRAGHFVDEMAVDKKNIRTILNISYHMRIPHFIKQGCRFTAHFSILLNKG